jgi:uncharacterized protein YjiS (DUF1127 family)
MTTIVNKYLTNPLSGFFRKLIQAIQQRKIVRTTLAELNRLNDRELNDLGITRGEIYSIAKGDKTRWDSHQVQNHNSNLKGWV